MKYLYLYLLFITVLIVNGCSQKKDNAHPEMADSTVQDNTSNTEAQISSKEKDTSEKQVIREGIIDVSTIDNNKDKKVYQCPMDWNVIDDKPGNCPLCKMDLEEYSLSEARENLVKNDYKVK